MPDELVTPVAGSFGAAFFYPSVEVTPVVGAIGAASEGALDSLPLAIGSVGFSGSVSVAVGGDLSITPVVGAFGATGRAPAVQGSEVLLVRKLVPDPGFETIWLVEIDWLNADPLGDLYPVGYSLYASVDCDVLGIFYDGRVAGDLSIGRKQADLGFGTITMQDVQVTLKNGDGALNTILTGANANGATSRNVKVRIRLWDPASTPQYISDELFGRLGQLIRNDEDVVLTIRDVDLSIFDRTIPSGNPIIDTDRWPNAVDIGSMIPLHFGEVAKTPMRYVDDKPLDVIVPPGGNPDAIFLQPGSIYNPGYKYIVGYGDLEVPRMFRRRTDGLFELIKPTLTPSIGYVGTIEWPLMQHFEGGRTMLRDVDFGVYGVDRAILLLALMDDAAAPINTVLYGPGNKSIATLFPGALTFTPIGSFSAANGMRIEAFVLISPPEGQAILQVEFDVPQPSWPGVIGLALSNVSQDIADYTLVATGGEGKVASVTVASELGDQIIGIMGGLSVPVGGGRIGSASQTPGPLQIELASAYQDPQLADPGLPIPTSPDSVTWQAGGPGATPTWTFSRHRNEVMTAEQIELLFAQPTFKTIHVGGTPGRDVKTGHQFSDASQRQQKIMQWVAGAVVLKGPPAHKQTFEDNLTIVRMRRRQVDPSGSLLPLYADVIESVTQRNHALAIRECLVNDVWGVNDGPADEAAFTAVADMLANLPDGPMLCDGAIVDAPIRLQDVLEQLSVVRALRPRRGALGWTIAADEPATDIAFDISEGPGQSPKDQILISHEGRRSQDLDQRVLRVILNYRFDYTGRASTQYLQTIKRNVFGSPGAPPNEAGTEHVLPGNLFLRDHLSADMTLAFNAAKDFFEDDRIPVVLSMHARALREGNIVRLNMPLLGYLDQLMKVGDNQLDSDQISALLLSYDLSIFAFVQSVPFPPANASLGDLEDFSQIPPEPASNLLLIRALSIINVTGNETISAIFQFSTPTVNFAKAILKYRQDADMDWFELPPVIQAGTVRVTVTGLIPLAVYTVTVQVLNAYGLKSMGDPLLTDVQMPGFVPITPVIHGRKK